MLKVLMETDNNFLGIGMQHILKAVYGKEVRFIQTVHYKYQENEDYDLYFFSISPGEDKVCHSRILKIPINKGVYFIMKNKGDALFLNKNNCLCRGGVINYSTSIFEIKEIILNNENLTKKRICCNSCSIPYFTPQEIMILKMFLSGLSTKETSLMSNLTETAVLTFLKDIRKKLGTKGKKDFYSIGFNFISSNRSRLFDI